MEFTETIAAISTPVGLGGISIVRVSGPKAFDVLEDIFLRPGGKRLSSAGKNTLSYGHIIDEEGAIIDEVLVGKMAGPHTYTTQDTAEINCHGGMTAAASILSLLYRKNVRAAEPGEFTKRAFLGGRIDLTQAEAVGDMITAQTTMFSRIAAGQIAGALAERINGITDKILNLLSELEVTIQYPEYDIPQITTEKLRSALLEISEEITILGLTHKKGEIARRGLKTVIAGKPNVGKSRLLNTLLNEDKAIVTDIPGTTRDVVDELVVMGTVPVRLMDTAGIRESRETVEAIGIERSIKAMELADLVLFVAEACNPPDEQDKSILAACANKERLILLNKCDRGVNEEALEFFRQYNPIIISAQSGEGIKKIEEAIVQYASGVPGDLSGCALIVNERHKALIDSAGQCLKRAVYSLDQGLPDDLIEIDIIECRNYLGQITGQTADEDIINDIFSKFCLGK